MARKKTKTAKRSPSAKRKAAEKLAGEPTVAPETASSSPATSDTEPPPAPSETPKPREDEPTVKVGLSGTARAAAAVALSEPRSTARILNRDDVCEAVYLEGLERGLSDREARDAAEDVADRLRLDGDCGEVFEDGSGFYDLRHEQDYVYPGGKNKVKKRGRTVVMRNPADIDTIVIHQTAVEFGVSKRAVAKAGGDVELARARRALDVACHAMAFRQGYFVAAHPLLAYVNHGNRFNSQSLGLEIDGRYPGLMDDPSTVAREDLNTTWRGNPTVLTATTLRTAYSALRWLVEEGRKLGCPITKVVSHRQSSDYRRSDPGEEIWRRLVLASADELGLTVVRESRWNQGRPVPLAWDDEGIGAY